MWLWLLNKRGSGARGDGGANQGGREGEKQSGVGITRNSSSRKLKGDNTKDTVGMGNIKWVNTGCSGGVCWRHGGGARV